ncbi:hypothetical protein BGZ73_007274 [Actinomortierella ambigua]|nr:hypothetical protein BGZ73_007274 [Actinomortierella ambigua]
MKFSTILLLSSLAALSQAVPHPRLKELENIVPSNENFSILGSSDELTSLLIKTHGSDVVSANGAGGFYMDKRFLHRWRVASTYGCAPEIASPKAIGKTLVCPEESAGPCTLSISYQDSQTFTDTVGMHSTFTVEGSVVAARAIATMGGSYQYTQSYSSGQTLTYTFQLPKATTCTPTQAMYQMNCKAAMWKIMNDKTEPACTSLQGIQWNTPSRWFKHDKDNAKTWQYMHDLESSPKLLTFTVPMGTRPGSCNDVSEVELRTTEVLKNDPKTLQSIAFAAGQSISAVTCLYQNN